jgi:hypothetical protein
MLRSQKNIATKRYKNRKKLDADCAGYPPAGEVSPKADAGNFAVEERAILGENYNRRLHRLTQKILLLKMGQNGEHNFSTLTGIFN